MLGYDYCYERAVRRISLLNKKKHGEFLSRLFSSLIRIIYPCDIDCHAVIGENVRIPHAAGIVVGYSAVIEDDVLIMSGVVIGSRFDHNGERGHATIKKGAMLGANCVILGRITIGEGAKIGAGAVITKDVPAHATVVGNNKIIKTS